VRLEAILGATPVTSALFGWERRQADMWIVRPCPDAHHPMQDDQRRDRDHDIGSKQMAAAESQTATAPAQTAGLGQRNE